MTNSRNVGLQEISSDVVSFIDDDSLPTHAWAQEVVAAFNRHPDAGCVAGRVTEAGREELRRALPHCQINP